MKTRTIFDNKTQILILVFILSVLLIIGGFSYIKFEKHSMLEVSKNQLKSIAHLKISRIDDWNKERLKDAESLFQSDFFAEGFEKWLGNKSDYSERQSLIKRISIINIDSAYSDVFITDTKGKLLLSLDSQLKQVDSVTARYVKEAVIRNKVVMTDFYKSAQEGQIYIDYISPIIGQVKKESIGAVVLRINPEKYLYPLIEQWPVASRTSETLIIRKQRDSVIFLNELRHQKFTALSLKIPLKSSDIAAVQAALGRRGIFEGKDYLGKEVLAYIAPIDGTRWIMIAKTSESEIYAGLILKEGITLLFILALIMILSLGLIWIYHYRQRNLYRQLLVKEKELLEYHKEFKTILYSIGDGIITADTEGKIKQINYVTEELTGWKESEALGRPVEEVFKIINGISRKEVENPVKKVLREGAIVGLVNHTLLISRDGTETPISDSGAPIRDEMGNIVGVVLIFRDKTEEYRAERLIRQSESRLKKAELVSKAGSWEFHLDTKKMIASEGAAKIYDIAGDEFDYERIKSVPLPEYRSKMDLALKNLIEKDEPYDVEFKIKALASGEIKDIHSVSIYDKDKRVLFGVIQDITERKKAEEQLHQSEESYRTTLYSIGDGVITTDNNGLINQMNPIAERLTGWQEIDAKKKPLELVFKIINEESRNSVESPVEKVLKEGKIVGLANHTLLIGRVGNEVPIADSGAPIIGSSSNIEGVVLVFRDQSKERAAQKAIMESLREKEILLKEIHHRVKNNFQQVIALISLQAGNIEDKNVLELFTDLQNRLRSMSLIHELMYGSENLAGVDIKDYIERLSRFLVQTYFASNRIKLNLDVENISLDIDSILPCGLIINEVITNSLKYAFPDESLGIINISFKKEEDKYCLIYSDNGIGIKDKIDFENIDSLGLRLVYLLTKQLKGKLEVVQSERGLQFIIKFSEGN